MFSGEIEDAFDPDQRPLQGRDASAASAFSRITRVIWTSSKENPVTPIPKNNPHRPRREAKIYNGRAALLGWAGANPLACKFFLGAGFLGAGLPSGR